MKRPFGHALVSFMLVLMVFVLVFVFFWVASIFIEKEPKNPIPMESPVIPLTESGMPLPVLDSKWKYIEKDSYRNYVKYIELEHGWIVSERNSHGGIGLTFVPKPAATPVRVQ